MPLLLYGRNRRWLQSRHGHDPPPSPSSTQGLNDARFRGRWAGRPRSFEMGWNHPRPRELTSLPSLPIPPPPICFCHLGRNLRSGSAPFTMAQHFPLSYRHGSTVQKGRGSECLHTRRYYCGSRVQPGSWLSGRQTQLCLESATLKGTLYWSCCNCDCEHLEMGCSTVCLV